MVQAQGDVRVLGGVRPGVLHLDLVERQLFGALAGNILEVNGLAAQVLQGEAVHVVPGGGGVQHIGLQHGVEAYAAQGYVVIGQHTAVVLEVLADFRPVGVFQQGLQPGQHLGAIQLRGCAQVVVGQRHIGRPPGSTAKDTPTICASM